MLDQKVEPETLLPGFSKLHGFPQQATDPPAYNFLYFLFLSFTTYWVLF
jgi:hypothetical protein